jgi:predicted nucleotidyltransferase
LTYVPRKGTNVPMKDTGTTPSSLGTLLLGKTRLSILSLLVPQPDRRLYLREIVRMTGAGQGAVQRELEKLTRVGILTKRREGNLTYYQANRMCPVFDELRGLVEKTAGIAGALREALLPMADSIDYAFLYGSIARGEEGGASDIDLMVLGHVSFLDVVAAISALQESLGREINPTVFTRAEFRQRIEEGDHFLTHVMKQERTDLIGGDREP